LKIKIALVQKLHVRGMGNVQNVKPIIIKEVKKQVVGNEKRI